MKKEMSEEETELLAEDKKVYIFCCQNKYIDFFSGILRSVYIQMIDREIFKRYK